MSKATNNEDINACIATLQSLLEDTNRLFDLPEE